MATTEQTGLDMITPHFFVDFADIDQWIKVDTQKRLECLQSIAFDDASPSNPMFRARIKGWLELRKSEENSRMEASAHDLNRRNVMATEAASAAAVSSARTSGTSARAAIFAAAISFFALALSVAAYFK